MNDIYIKNELIRKIRKYQKLIEDLNDLKDDIDFGVIAIELNKDLIDKLQTSIDFLNQQLQESSDNLEKELIAFGTFVNRK